MIKSNQPLFSPSRYRVCVPLQAVIISVTSLLAMSLAFRILPPELGRVALAGLFALQLGFELRRGERNFLLSPAFLLAFVVLMAFSIIPSFLHQVLSWFDPLEVPSNDNLYLALPRLIIISYFGSQAESWILTFSAVVLTLHALIRTLCGNAIENSPATGIGRDYYRTFMFAFSALFTTLFIFQTQTVFFSSSMTALFQTFFRPDSVFRLAFSAPFRDEQKTISTYWGAVTLLRRCRRNGIGKTIQGANLNGPIRDYLSYRHCADFISPRHINYLIMCLFVRPRSSASGNSAR